MRILGLTPCFFPVCEGLEGGWELSRVTVVVVVVVGLDWIGLDRIGLDRIGLDRIGWFCAVNWRVGNFL